MANPSDKGARGPAGPIAEPFITTPRGPAPSGVPTSGMAPETPSPGLAAGRSSTGAGAGQSPGFGSGQPASETAPDRPSKTLDSGRFAWRRA